MPSKKPRRPTRPQRREINAYIAIHANTAEKVMLNRRRLEAAILGDWKINKHGLGGWATQGEPCCIAGLVRREFGGVIGSCANLILGMPQNLIGHLTDMNDRGKSPEAIATAMMQAPIRIWSK